MIRRLALLAVAAAALIVAPACAQTLAAPREQFANDWETNGGFNFTSAGLPMPSTAAFNTVFTDDFTTDSTFDCVDASFSGSVGNHKWYGSHDAFGSATLAPCTSNGPNWQNQYSLSAAGLTMTLSYNSALSAWWGASIATSDFFGSNRAQNATYGYWEATIVYPSLPATGLPAWPAFWTLGRYMTPGDLTQAHQGYREMDIPEGGLVPANGLNYWCVTGHIWPPTTYTQGYMAPGTHKYAQTCFNKTLTDNQPHVWSLLRSAEWEIYGLDGLEIGRRRVLAKEEVAAPVAAILTVAANGTNTASTGASWSMIVKKVVVKSCVPSVTC